MDPYKIVFDDVTHRPMWRKIYEHVQADDNALAMGDWQVIPEGTHWEEAQVNWCGTSACIAGWAYYFLGHGGLLELADIDVWVEVGHSLGLSVGGHLADSPVYYLDDRQGRELLRLVAEEGMTPMEGFDKVHRT